MLQALFKVFAISLCVQIQCKHHKQIGHSGHAHKSSLCNIVYKYKHTNKQTARQFFSDVDNHLLSFPPLFLGFSFLFIAIGSRQEAACKFWNCGNASREKFSACTGRCDVEKKYTQPGRTRARACNPGIFDPLRRDVCFKPWVRLVHASSPVSDSYLLSEISWRIQSRSWAMRTTSVL